MHYKYIKKVKTSSGKWRYIYPDDVPASERPLTKAGTPIGSITKNSDGATTYTSDYRPNAKFSWKEQAKARYMQSRSNWNAHREDTKKSLKKSMSDKKVKNAIVKGKKIVLSLFD